MATLVFSAVGTLVGGPLGGAIGALVGRQVDASLLGAGSRRGPRLKELNATTSSYGAAIPRHFGQMRIDGSIIWATDLVEHSDTQQSSKSSPSITTYSYTASFAVALASRPIARIGRIWADGNLLRGAAGDLKTAGAMRFYSGEADQDADPLIAAAEGSDRCPAYRGIAYVVFEDLALADFYNRIPALTFEVFADETAWSLQDIAGSFIDAVDADLPLTGIGGLSCEGPLADTLQALDPMFPMDCDAGGDVFTIAQARLQGAPLVLGEATISSQDDDFGRGAGYARKRAPAPATPTQVLRYYDIDRDYLPGTQRAMGQAGPGEPETVDLAAAMHAADARQLAETMARRADWSRETLAWRTAELDPAAAPGAIVIAPEQSGRWLVNAWEWRDTGVELSLSRVVPVGADASLAFAADPGRINAPQDLGAPQTLLHAFELPWNGTGGGDTPSLFAATSAATANWKGAALFVDSGDGNLRSLGPSGRVRSIVGVIEGAVAPADPLMLDRSTIITVALADADMALTNADLQQLAEGANQALIGEEVVQFARATALGAGRWRLEALLRGRGGTEAATGAHQPGEAFVLLDQRPVSLAASVVGAVDGTTILATGLGDSEPACSPIAMQGITRRPLSPCHPHDAWTEDGGLELSWTRRARGAWYWDDGVDVPLAEGAEAYQVGFGDTDAPLATWAVAEPRIVLDSATIATLRGLGGNGDLWVRQSGSYALSPQLLLTVLS